MLFFHQDKIQKTTMFFFLSLCILLLSSCTHTNTLKGRPIFASNKLNAFVDLSHHDSKVDLSKAKDVGGLVGFFHKATQGSSFVDNKYGERIEAGRKLNLLMGAYHFGTAEPVAQQVDAFIATINQYGSTGIVPVLDWEPNPITKQGTMSRKQAADFINLFFQKTGVYPMVYGGYWMLLQLADEKNIETFAKTPLWQGFYSSTFGYLDGIWKTWSFIQYTDGHIGPEPHEMEGIGAVDRDFFNGNLEQAKAFWKKHSLK
ncbi:MAG: glycoside hydrolase family 25 protein [Ostreibacterium sp.]